jgi:small subunit ribosomal protein S20
MKRARQSAVRRSRNLQVKRAIHNETRAVLDAAAVGDAKLTAEKLREAQSEIDRAVKKGTFHKNTAARRKSRLVKASKVSLEAHKPAKPVKNEDTEAVATAPKKAPAAKKPATAKKPASKKKPAAK